MQYDLLCIADTIENQILPGYYDLLGVSARFGQLTGCHSQLIIFSRDEILPTVPESLMQNESCKIQFVNMQHPRFNHPHPPLFADSLISRIESLRPRYICLPHTARCCQMAAALAAKLDAALITGVDEIMNSERRTLFSRNVMNGKYAAKIHSRSDLTVFTVNQGAFAPADKVWIDIDEKDISRERLITVTDTKFNVYDSLGLTPAPKDDSSVEDADVVVAAGRGIGPEENLKLIRDTAALFKNAAIGASRPLCDLGWLPYSHQIGETGKQVAPRVYIACGISGANQHINGIRQAQTVVAINSDSQAAIFRYADYGIVARLEEFLPCLVERWAKPLEDGKKGDN